MKSCAERYWGKEDCEHDRKDYDWFLCVVDAAGSYEESVYFLPFAFSRILTHPEEALDLIHLVIGFATEYPSELRADGDFEAVRSAIREVLDALTSEFPATPGEDVFVGGVCVQNQFDHVRQAQVIEEALGCLVQGRVYLDIGEKFVRSLAESLGHPAKASWFLSLAYWADSGYSELLAHAPMIEIIRDEKLLLAAAATVRKELETLGKQSWYWKDCFDQLCL